MSFRLLCDRLVTVRPMVAGVEDERGNKPATAGEDVEDVPARRQLVEATEDVTNRDEQAQTFVYDLALFTTAGASVALTGRDRIVDGDDVFEVIGTPNVVSRRRRPHHIEARATLVEG